MPNNAGVEKTLVTLQHLFGVMRFMMVLLLLAYIGSGSFIIHPEEQAFVLRFGALVGDTREKQILTSGRWYWAFPKPITTVIRIPVKQARTVHTNAFWYQEKQLATSEDHRSPIEQGIIPGVDGYLLSGDVNILHAKWSISYRVIDPIAYHGHWLDPEKILRHILENTVLQVVSQKSIEETLYRGSEDIRLQVFDQMKRKISMIDIGVVIQNITYDARNPPSSLISSFRSVIEADQKKATMVTQAHGYSLRKEQEIIGNSSRILSEAKLYRQQTVASVKADEYYFTKILEEYQKAPETVLMTLHMDTLDDVFRRVTKKYIIHTNDQKQEIRLLLGDIPDFIRYPSLNSLAQ